MKKLSILKKCGDVKHKIWNQTSGWGSNYDCKRQWRWRFNVRPSSGQVLHRRTIAFLDAVRVRVGSDGTRKIPKYARRRWSQRKLCYRLVVILTCKWIIVFFVSLAVFPFVKFAILTGEHFCVNDKILAILLCFRHFWPLESPPSTLWLCRFVISLHLLLLRNLLFLLASIPANSRVSSRVCWINGSAIT